MKNSVRRGLFHPDDIKTIGLASTSSPAVSAMGLGPLSAPLPGLTRKTSRPSLSPRGSWGTSAGSGAVTPVSATSGGHVRSGSLAGSFGKAEAKKVQNQAEFGKYAEDDEEDYEDVFGKPNATCNFIFPLTR